MEYRKLPHGTEELSTIGLGMDNIAIAADEEIENTIAYAINHGINFFDMVCGRTGVYEAFARVTKGKIKHFGFSFHGSPELLDKVLAEHPEVEFVQI